MIFACMRLKEHTHIILLMNKNHLRIRVFSPIRTLSTSRFSSFLAPISAARWPIQLPGEHLSSLTRGAMKNRWL